MAAGTRGGSSVTRDVLFGSSVQSPVDISHEFCQLLIILGAVKYSKAIIVSWSKRLRLCIPELKPSPIDALTPNEYARPNTATSGFATVTGSYRRKIHIASNAALRIPAVATTDLFCFFIRLGQSCASQ